jgi:hypothetical protein
MASSLSISACGQDQGVDEEEFFSNLVVPVSSEFAQEDAQKILEQCNATDSAITILEDGRAQFEPVDGMSVDTSACVLDQLISSGKPLIEGIPVEPAMNIGPEPKAS